MDLKLVKSNLINMLNDRNYKLLTRDDENNKMIFDDKDTKVIVYFSNYNNKSNKEYVRNIIQETEEAEIRHLILVNEDSLTPSANKYIESFPMKIEFFLFEELKFNITTHKLVPKHVLLSQDESTKIIEYYGKKHLPQIKQKDPISRYFNADIGQIFRIHRNEGGIFYRLVIS